MGAALHGNLKDFGIAEVFQLIGQQRKTGMLEIAGDTNKVQLAFDQGAVVWAAPVGDSEFAVLGDRLVRCGLITRPRLHDLVRESDASARSLPSLLIESGVVAESDLEAINDLLSRETIFEVMRWSGGSFHFHAQPIHHEVAPEKLLAAEQILMDGLRMIDEWQTFKDRVPSNDTVFARTGRLDVYRQKAGLSPGDAAQMERVHQLVDGRLTARRIIDLSRLGTFEATRLLAEMHQHGVIAPVEPGKTVAVRPKRPSRAIGQSLRAALAVALPMALLAGAVHYGLQQRPVSADFVGTPVAHSPLRDAREHFERRRISNRLEAQRMTTGDWPETLAEARATAGKSDFAMAPESARPYYYVQRDEGILLLAPKR